MLYIDHMLYIDPAGLQPLRTYMMTDGPIRATCLRYQLFRLEMMPPSVYKSDA
jgi:hypothetical protein